MTFRIFMWTCVISEQFSRRDLKLMAFLVCFKNLFRDLLKSEENDKKLSAKMIIFSEISGLQTITLLKMNFLKVVFKEFAYFSRINFSRNIFSGCFPVKQKIRQEIRTGYMKICGMKIVINPSLFILIFVVIHIHIQSYKNLSLFIYSCVAVE